MAENIVGIFIVLVGVIIFGKISWDIFFYEKDKFNRDWLSYYLMMFFGFLFVLLYIIYDIYQSY